MRQIFYHYKEWEDYQAGKWRNVEPHEENSYLQWAVDFMSDTEKFGEAMGKVVKYWPKTTRHHLTNPNINPKAWLGQAACCFENQCPEHIVRQSWVMLSESQQILANNAANMAILEWKRNYSCMGKTPLGINVFHAAKERISWTFDNFEKIYLSFSAGKDSTVMLHMVMDEAIKRKRKIGVLLIDLEGQYKLTIDHALACYDEYRDFIEPYWICLPIHLRNAVSVFETFWVCWDKEKEKSWIRDIPPIAISDTNYFPFFHEGMEFEEFVPLFGEWYGQGKSCACFVGIRSDESLNRYRTIASKNKIMKDGKQFTTQVLPDLFNIYPIYDWKTSDIWIYHAKHPEKKHNRLYDLMHKAGLTISQMRICQPYGDDQRRGLWLFHLIEPETWARVVARVNGANSGSLYVNESGNITGYRRISKPEGHTWKSFAELLINSMPPKTKQHYENKIFIFTEWWEKRGYPEGIPDEADYKLEADRKVPSWRRICKSLLRNDYWCKGLSFTQTKSDAYDRYLEMIKKKKQRADEQKGRDTDAAG
jgi:predicted phosphoadenosine phosphosulfate sulfurtransferase